MADTTPTTSPTTSLPASPSSPESGSCSFCKETLTVAVNIAMASQGENRSLRTYCAGHWDTEASTVMLRKETTRVDVKEWMHHPLRAFCCRCNTPLFTLEERKRSCSRGDNPHRSKRLTGKDAEVPLPNIPPRRRSSLRVPETNQILPPPPPPVNPRPAPNRLPSPQTLRNKERSQSLSPCPGGRSAGRYSDTPGSHLADRERSVSVSSLQTIVNMMPQTRPRRRLPYLPHERPSTSYATPSSLWNEGDDNAYVFNPSAPPRELPFPDSDSSCSCSSGSMVSVHLMRQRSRRGSRRSRRDRDAGVRWAPGTASSESPASSKRGGGRPTWTRTPPPIAPPPPPRPRPGRDTLPRNMSRVRASTVTRWSPTPTERRSRPHPAPVFRSPPSPERPASEAVRQRPDPRPPSLDRAAASAESISVAQASTSRRRRNPVAAFSRTVWKLVSQYFQPRK